MLGNAARSKSTHFGGVLDHYPACPDMIIMPFCEYSSNEWIV